MVAHPNQFKIPESQCITFRTTGKLCSAIRSFSENWAENMAASPLTRVTLPFNPVGQELYKKVLPRLLEFPLCRCYTEGFANNIRRSKMIRRPASAT